MQQAAMTVLRFNAGMQSTVAESRVKQQEAVFTFQEQLAQVQSPLGEKGSMVAQLRRERELEAALAEASSLNEQLGSA